MNRPKVYLTNDKGYDMSTAKEHGELVVLFPEPVNDVFAVSKQSFLLKQKLTNAESGDYLAVVGNFVLVLITFGILMQKFGFVNLLLYDVRAGQYVPRVLAKHQL